MKRESRRKPPADPLAEVAAAVERTIRAEGPHLTRAVKYGAPTFQGAGDVITIGRWTNFVAVGFWSGAKLAPRHPVLEGSAPSSRVAKIRTVREAKSPAFRALIREAVQLDAVAPVHPVKK